MTDDELKREMLRAAEAIRYQCFALTVVVTVAAVFIMIVIGTHK